VSRGIVMWGEVSHLWFDVIKARPRFYQNIYRSSSSGEFTRIMRTYITNFYLEIVQYQLGRKVDSEIMFIIQMYLAGATEKIGEWVLNGARMSIEELSRLLYLAMPEKIRNLVILNELDATVAKMIARDAYPES